MRAERSSTVQALRKERVNRPHSVRLQHHSQPQEIQVAAPPSVPGSGQHHGAGEAQEMENPLDSRASHSINQGRRETLSSQKDQKWYPIDGTRVGNEGGTVNTAAISSSRSLIPKAGHHHLVRTGEEDHTDRTDRSIEGRV